jgi:hypothetical protein
MSQKRIPKLHRTAAFLFSWIACLLYLIGPGSSPALAQKKLRILSASYDQHHRPTESVTFRVIIQNNEPTNEGAELVIVATNIRTGQELTLADVGSGPGAVPAGGTFTFLTTVPPISNGLYTITFLLLDGAAFRVDRLTGKFPLHIGTETESLHVFPEVIHLGTIPPGRTMFPTPIEVRWDYFRFNRTRFDQPFTIRIYTDNAARYTGIPGALRRPSAAGLVSLDGRYVLPLKVWCLNFGPDIQETGWDAALAGPPPVDDDDYWLGPPLIEGKNVAATTRYDAFVRGRNVGSAAWVRVPDWSDMTANPTSWRRLIGQDPFDNRFVSDSNVTGDFTLRSPFTFYLATEAGPTAVEGSYSATLVVELWTP